MASQAKMTVTTGATSKFCIRAQSECFETFFPQPGILGWDNYYNFRVAGIRFISKQNLKDGNQVGIRLDRDVVMTKNISIYINITVLPTQFSVTGMHKCRGDMFFCQQTARAQ